MVEHNFVHYRGCTLITSTDVENLGIDTPKTGTLGGVSFQRSKNGNMYRWGVVKAQRYVSCLG